MEYEKVFVEAISALGDCGFEVEKADKSSGSIIATSPMSFWSWGETIKVSISVTDEGVEVVAQSNNWNSPPQINGDWKETNIYILQQSSGVVEIEEVAEEFVNLVLNGKLEQARKLAVRESTGRENELADWIRIIGIEYGNNEEDFVALHCFKVALKIAKLKNIKKKILEDLVIAHNNYGNLLSHTKRYKEAEDHYKKALRINPT